MKTRPSKDNPENTPYAVLGGVVNVEKCTVCGKSHPSLEIEYTSPAVEMDGVLYTLTAKCPKTGETIYFSVTAHT